MSSRFRKRPVEIDAVQWLGEVNCEEVFAFLGEDHPVDETSHCAIYIPTLEGIMTAVPGDWIIKGVMGEFYPCKREIFDMTYEPVVSIAHTEKDKS